MVRVTLTTNLRKYYPEAEFEVDAKNIGELLAEMDAKRPNFSSYILEDNGMIRKHVNIFINGEITRDPNARAVALSPGTEVHIMQALSGG